MLEFLLGFLVLGSLSLALRDDNESEQAVPALVKDDLPDDQSVYDIVD